MAGSGITNVFSYTKSFILKKQYEIFALTFLPYVISISSVCLIIYIKNAIIDDFIKQLIIISASVLFALMWLLFAYGLYRVDLLIKNYAQNKELSSEQFARKNKENLEKFFRDFNTAIPITILYFLSYIAIGLMYLIYNHPFVELLIISSFFVIPYSIVLGGRWRIFNTFNFAFFDTMFLAAVIVNFSGFLITKQTPLVFWISYPCIMYIHCIYSFIHARKYLNSINNNDN